MFYIMVDKCIMTQWQMEQVICKYILFLSTLPIRRNNFTSFSADN